MGQSENPIFGRKVFFLNSPYAIKTSVIERLRTNEYEAFYIDDVGFAKPILRQNPDSICFINIDYGFSIKEWFNFVVSFQKDEILKTIYIGILSQKIRLADKNQFLLKTEIPGGFIMLDEGLDKITEKIIKICEINGAKGRRQYVRLDCKQKTDATVHIEKNGRLFTMKLIDISSCGFACAIAVKEKERFTEKEVLKNIIISLGKKSINCEAAIFAIKDGLPFATIVMLLMPSTPSATRTLIRNYVFSSLQESINISINGIIKDTTDYSIEDKTINDKANTFIFEEDENLNIENISDIEDLEEIGDLETAFV
ncbi:MAG: hypothetical protein KBT21_00900 [Treponema sp.]|nr:hypothetical protein [Candidatus Treponema merdequi]